MEISRVYGLSLIHIFFAAMAAAIFILFILCIVLFVKLNGQKKRYDYFMGSNRRPTHNLEMKIEEYFETSKKIESQYSKLLDMVTDMDKTDKSKIQKVGLIPVSYTHLRQRKFPLRMQRRQWKFLPKRKWAILRIPVFVWRRYSARHPR